MKRDFKGIWIPREIWEAKDLDFGEKCLWAEINSLCDRAKGGCYASNDYIMEKFGVNERKLQRMLASLKKKGWLITKSFNGRERILYAVVPCEDMSLVEDCHPRGDKFVTPPVTDLSPPTYIEKKAYSKEEYNPLKVPVEKPQPEKPAPGQEPPSAMPAKAGEKRVKDLSPESAMTAVAFCAALQRRKPDFPIPPQKLFAIQTYVDFMLRLDKRDPDKIIDVLKWALADSFWADKLYKPNPAKYLREKFDQLEMKMNAVPEQKQRRFAASSNDEKAKAIFDDMASRAI